MSIAQAAATIAQDDLKMDVFQVEEADGEGVVQSKVPLKGGDDAAQYLAGQTVEYTAEEEGRLLRKCDIILIPVMAMGTAFSYIDKIALGNAATLTLKADLDLTGDQLAFFPQSLQRYHTGQIMAGCMLCWGGITLASMAAHNFSEMAALRFLLGVFEPAIVPGLILTTARFYKPREVPIRIAFWTLANTLMPIPFSVIYYGLGNLPNHPLQQWRWIYVLLGIITMLLSIAVLVVIPDQPATCWWLKQRERIIIVHRVSQTQIGQKTHEFKWYQVKEALTDPKAWILAVAMCCQQSGASVVTNFSGQIIVGLGFSGLQALILQIPGWVCSCGMLLTTGILGTYTIFFRTRKLLILVASCTLAIVSLAVLKVYPPGSNVNKGMQLFFISLLNGHTGAYSGLVMLSGQNVAGTTKKTTVVAMMLIGFSVSNMLVPLSFKASEAPAYKTGITTVMSLLCVCWVSYIALYALIRAENSKRDRLQAGTETHAEDADDLDTGLQDLTDKENPKFRYLS